MRLHAIPSMAWESVVRVDLGIRDFGVGRVTITVSGEPCPGGVCSVRRSEAVWQRMAIVKLNAYYVYLIYQWSLCFISKYLLFAADINIFVSPKILTGAWVACFFYLLFSYRFPSQDVEEYLYVEKSLWNQNMLFRILDRLQF